MLTCNVDPRFYNLVTQKRKIIFLDLNLCYQHLNAGNSIFSHEYGVFYPPSSIAMFENIFMIVYCITEGNLSSGRCFMNYP